MRSIMMGLAVLGTLAAGGIRAEAHPLPASPAVVQPSAVQQVDWGYCGPRCQEQRREVRQREIERQRLAEHRRWEQQRWQVTHRHPQHTGITATEWQRRR